MKTLCRFVLSLLTLIIATSCSVSTDVGSYKPKEGQPNFPPLNEYWVIDNGCNFDPEAVKMADEVFENLRFEGIAEVAVVCQKGITNHGSSNNEKIWARDWGRWAKLGDKEDRRAVVWLIRPDVTPSEYRVTIEVSRWLTWYTAVDYIEALQEAGNYANWNDFTGALESIARNTDAKLRELWETRK